MDIKWHGPCDWLNDPWLRKKSVGVVHKVGTLKSGVTQQGDPPHSKCDIYPERPSTVKKMKVTTT